MTQTQPTYTSLTVCVADASVLIDLDNAGVVSKLAALPYRLIIPDAVADELPLTLRDTLWALALENKCLTESIMAEVYVAQRVNTGLSIPDLSALYLVRNLQAILLTGDGPLRRAAQSLNLAVHGVLWVLDELVASGHLAPHEALAALGQMVAAGARLPIEECERRRAVWAG